MQSGRNLEERIFEGYGMIMDNYGPKVDEEGQIIYGKTLINFSGRYTNPITLYHLSKFIGYKSIAFWTDDTDEDESDIGIAFFPHSIDNKDVEIIVKPPEDGSKFHLRCIKE